MEGYGAVIKKFRRNSGHTQREIANQLGVDFTYISKIENERLERPPSQELITRLCAEIGLDEMVAFDLLGIIPVRGLQDAAQQNVIYAQLLRQLGSGKVSHHKWLAAYAAVCQVESESE